MNARELTPRTTNENRPGEFWAAFSSAGGMSPQTTGAVAVAPTV
jgi:hypothetical protein